MSKSKKLVFFGTDDFSAPSLRALIDNAWDIEAVITKPDRRSGRGRQLEAPKVKSIAKSHSIRVLQPANIEELRKSVKDTSSEIAVLVAYGRIIPQDVIDHFKLGIVNVHPSLLPKYRGPAPIEAAILNGDSETGISIMKLSAKMDAGPIYTQTRVPLIGSETKPKLYSKLANTGAALLNESLSAIIEGSMSPRSQDESLASYTKLLEKDDGLIDWSKTSAEIDRIVRAYQGFPKPRTRLFDKYDVVIIKGRTVTNDSKDSLIMKTADGLYEIQELIGPSGKLMSGEAFLRGYKA